MVEGRAASPFGTRLRQWRGHRGLSQLALAGPDLAPHRAALQTLLRAHEP